MLALLTAAAVLFAQDPAAAGPYPVDDRDEERCTVFAPRDLGQNHPVILWGNGTGAPVAAYAPILRRLASHGFVVAAAKTGQAGSGMDLVWCLERLQSDPKGVWRGHVDLSKVGATGHSQGGSGALAAARRDARITAVAPLQPGGRAGEGRLPPMLLLSGGADTTTPPARAHAPLFEAAEGPVVWATLDGASHRAPMSVEAGPYAAALVAFFRWRLMGDEASAAWFEGEACGLCRDPAWTVRRK